MSPGQQSQPKPTEISRGREQKEPLHYLLFKSWSLNGQRRSGFYSTRVPGDQEKPFREESFPGAPWQPNSTSPGPTSAGVGEHPALLELDLLEADAYFNALPEIDATSDVPTGLPLIGAEEAFTTCIFPVENLALAETWSEE